MQEDWIHWGRHPSGLFGAALLIAARLHGFKRSRKEVSNVVYITDVTIGLRLGDFSNTPSAALSMAEFDNKDLSPCNPPAFERSQNRQTEKDLKIKWPKKLPSRPKDVQNWIENGMGFGKHDKKIKVKNAEHFEEKFEDPILLEENFEDEEENVFCDSEDLDRMADLYIIKDTKEKDRKFKIWELMNREWTETKKRKEEEKRLEKEMKSKKKPKKERKSKRTMPLGYKTVLEDFEKEESKIYNKIGDEALLDNLLDEKIDLDLFGIDGIDDF
ncbi:transcription factor TFIIIB subunit brf1 [Bonamia ostreae]|uniref:Transcription factor TFIIIB subunit brf1 n=1 Tax=Bonamia ostreae TaxID=126728 RepID=A0ABV2AL33_9EUKA